MRTSLLVSIVYFHPSTVLLHPYIEGPLLFFHPLILQEGVPPLDVYIALRIGAISSDTRVRA